MSEDSLNKQDLDGKCVECDDGVWVCSSEGDPDCSMFPTIAPQWSCVGCEDLEVGDYFIFCRPGHCEVKIVANDGGGIPRIQKFKYAGAFKVSTASKYARYCQKGGQGGCRAAVKPVTDCPADCS